MPTLVLAVAKLIFLMLPNTSELLLVTCALAPMAVAFVGLKVGRGKTSALYPMAVLWSPPVLERPAFWPKKELKLPKLLPLATAWPKNALAPPVMLKLAASAPKNAFSEPSVLWPALYPKKAL